ncbi:MAG: type IV pilus biogenesis/stability protein PilW [Gammaproteobacteria bacterium]|nr:type IV pilus biogenesis/stability protein PilW [Gammaproteobacteria bacterium]
MKQMHKIITTALLMVCLSFLAACETTSSMQKTTVKTQEPDLMQAAELNTQLAVGYIQRKQYKPARDKLEKAIEQNPNYLPAYKTLAYLYAVLGQPEKAEERYQQALELKPLDADLSNNYGAFLCTQGKYDEAQQSFKVAYSDPFYESTYLAESNAGSCYVEQGNYELGEAFLRKSLRKDPKLAGSLISMADIAIKTERYLMARAYIERYNAVKTPTAASLWIQVLAEKNLGAKEYYMKYAREILEKFPDSDEAGWVEAQARSDRPR